MKYEDTEEPRLALVFQNTENSILPHDSKFDVAGTLYFLWFVCNDPKAPAVFIDFVKLYVLDYVDFSNPDFDAVLNQLVDLCNQLSEQEAQTPQNSPPVDARIFLGKQGQKQTPAEVTRALEAAL